LRIKEQETHLILPKHDDDDDNNDDDDDEDSLREIGLLLKWKDTLYATFELKLRIHIRIMKAGWFYL